MTIDDLPDIDRLNRLLDRSTDRPRSTAADHGEGGDADWDATLRRLLHLDGAFGPPPGALARVRADLGLPGSGGRGGTAGRGGSPLGPDPTRGTPGTPAGRIPWPRRGRTILAEAATAAIVVLSLLSGYLWYRLLESERSPEPAVVAPGPEGCLVAPKEFELGEVGRVIFPAPTPAGGREASTAPRVDLGVGRPADAPTRDAISATVQELVACSNAGSYGRFLALTTDGYQRSYFDRAAASFGTGIDRMMAAAALSSGEVDPRPREEWIAVRAVEEVVVLPDGRLGAEIDVERALPSTSKERRSEVVVFVRSGDRWLLDSGLAPTLPALGATPAP